MKKAILFTFASLIICLSVTVSAAISPAVDIISKSLSLKKCVTSTGVVTFSKDELQSFFGKNVSEITVSSLPSSSCGILRCAGVELREGSGISQSAFSGITFTPSYDTVGNCSFSFTGGDKTLTCQVFVSDTVNSSPVTGKQSLDTQKNIALYKTFSAADPDGDSLEYEIVSYPSHGSVFVNNTDGMFVYRPLEGYTGNDSFSYTATDIYGNSSKSTTVQIKVSKPSCNIYFSDMKNHWAHNAAVNMASTGLMTGRVADGKHYFDPDQDMTRGDFLALSLITAGHEKDIPMANKTVFADDSMIPLNIKSYAQYAYDKGIINGYTNPDGSVNFEPQGSITKAEAAVITSNILGLGKTDAEDILYTDAAAIPAWATDEISSLTVCGIINGTPGGFINPQKVLSRAEGAQMICNVADYLDDMQAKKPKKRTLFNLFGLLG